MLILAPALSFATEGKVIAYKSSCELLLIDSEKGYLLLKQQSSSSYTPKKGDLIDGFFIENFGISHLHKVSSSEVMWVFNEFATPTKQDATGKYVQACGPINNTNPIINLLNKLFP